MEDIKNVVYIKLTDIKPKIKLEELSDIEEFNKDIYLEKNELI